MPPIVPPAPTVTCPPSNHTTRFLGTQFIATTRRIRQAQQSTGPSEHRDVVGPRSAGEIPTNATDSKDPSSAAIHLLAAGPGDGLVARPSCGCPLGRGSRPGSE